MVTDSLLRDNAINSSMGPIRSILTHSGSNRATRSDVFPIEGTVKASFQGTWRDRCINENAISPSVYDSNIRFLTGQDVFEAIEWKIPNQRGSGGIRAWNEAAAFVGEDGEVWQLKLDVPRVSKDGKDIKYESIKAGGSRLFFPAVPIESRKLISKIWGVNVPLAGSFWAWFCSSIEARKIPLFPTEGGCKALSLVSHGFVSVSLYGCSSAWEKKESKYDRRELLPQLREAARGRLVAFAFDSDIKPNAVLAVRAAIAVIGKALYRQISPTVKVVEWDAALGKGCDDLISQNGAAAFVQAFENAPDFSAWKSSSTKEWARKTYTQYSARAKADITASADRVSDCNFRLPNLGEALLFDSFMGSGKTHSFGDVIKALRRNYPDLIVDAIGHRNNLLVQTSNRLGLNHIHDLAAGKYTQLQVVNADSLAYCADSLWRRFDALIGYIASGKKLLLILDEIDAVVKHIHQSSTIKPADRIRLIRKFSILLSRIGLGGGWVLGGEAVLTQLSVDSLRSLSSGTLKVTVARNDRKPTPWNCTVKLGYRINSKGVQIAVSAKQTAMDEVSKRLEAGQRVALLATSQEAAEQFDKDFSENYTVWRLDSKTSAEPENKDAFKDMTAAIKNSPAQLIILSPTLESGVSIDGSGLVDAIVLYASGLEPSTSYQMLGRFRDPTIPRVICADEVGFSTKTKGTFDPALMLQSWRDKTLKIMQAHDAHVEVDPVLAVAHDIASKYVTREAAGIAGLRENLIEKLELEGHSTERSPVQVEGYADRLKAAKEAVENQTRDDWMKADDSELSADQARDRMKDSGLRYIDRVVCKKAIDREKYGDLVDEESWVDEYCKNNRKGKQLKNAVRSAAEYVNEGMAAASDGMKIKSQLKLTGTIWGVDMAVRDLAMSTLKNLNLEGLLPIVDTDVEIHAEHPSVRAIFRSALRIPDEVADTLNLHITPDTSPMAFVSDLLFKRLGYKFEVRKVTIPCNEESSIELIGHENPHTDIYEDFGAQLNNDVDEPQTIPPKKGRGRPPKSGATKGKTKQIRVYRLVSCPHHGEMVEAIKADHDRAIEKFDDKPSPDLSTQVQPGRSINWDGQLWTVLSVRGDSVWLYEGRSPAPLHMCVEITMEYVLLGLNKSRTRSHT